LAEREEEAHKNARAATHAGLKVVTNKQDKPTSSTPQPRVGVADRGPEHGPVSSTFKVVDGGQSRAAVLTPESHEDGDTDLPMAA
jgi:hypothetical protein